MEIEQEHKNLIRKLKHGGFIKNEEMEKAFREIDRIDFVLEEYEDEAYKDIPLPILCGQTISQ
ncbi:MAG: protein-L-isoaspartate O-methyltransferase, partial [Patescibacteria group bacterium]